MLHTIWDSVQFAKCTAWFG